MVLLLNSQPKHIASAAAYCRRSKQPYLRSPGYISLALDALPGGYITRFRLRSLEIILHFLLPQASLFRSLTSSSKVDVCAYSLVERLNPKTVFTCIHGPAVSY